MAVSTWFALQSSTGGPGRKLAAKRNAKENNANGLIGGSQRSRGGGLYSSGTRAADLSAADSLREHMTRAANATPFFFDWLQWAAIESASKSRCYFTALQT